MASFKNTLRTKGVKGTFKKIGFLISRFGVSSSKMLMNITEYEKIAEDYDIMITLPITALTLKLNINSIKKLNLKHIEFALHGYKHIDLKTLSTPSLEEHIRKGVQIFEDFNIKLYGFRAPYLSFDKRLIKILQKYGFFYDSSKSCKIINMSEDRNIRNILNFYSPSSLCNMERFGNLVEIPVSLPDDEILIDRLGWNAKDIGKLWIHMCKKTIDNKGIPVIQLHPERITLCRDSLIMVLKWAINNNIDILPLKNIDPENSENRKVMAITGDIDIMKVSDYIYIR